MDCPTPQAQKLISLSTPAGNPQELNNNEFEAFNLRKFITDDEPDCFLCESRGDSADGRTETGDILIVNPKLKPHPGDLIVAKVDGDYVIRTYKERRHLYLVPRLEQARTLNDKTDDELNVFGIVITRVQKIRRASHKDE